MAEKGLISILLPFKDEAKFIGDCLKSIVAQSYSSWELIAVNDHSMDGGAAIAREIAHNEPRIKVLENEGEGIIAALQTAFTASSGGLITRMDGDDLMPPDKLLRMQAYLQELGPGHVVTGLVKYFSESELGGGYVLYQDWLNGLCSNNSHYEAIYKECVIASPCWMLFREDLIRCDAFQPQDYPEDYDLVFRFYREKLKVQAIEEVLHLWRDYPERTSRTDPRYSDQRFFELKLRHFLSLDQRPESPLLLWGAGRKGKQLAHLLQRNKLEFVWMCNNNEKIGKDFGGKTMQDFRSTADYNDPQILIAIGNSEDQKFISKYLLSVGLQPNRNFYFFC